MIKQDIVDYLEKNHHCFLESFKELSYDSENEKSLIDDEEHKAYSFDKLSNELTKPKKYASVDCILPKKSSVFFIEFKTGFNRSIDIDETKLACPDDKTKKCFEYGKLWKRYNKRSLEILNMSMSAKAVESFLIVDKYILPQCPASEKTYKLHLVAVTDINEAPLDSFEDMQSNLAKLPTPCTNRIDDLRKSLKQYGASAKVNDECLLYDEIQVITAEEFKAIYAK